MEAIIFTGIQASGKSTFYIQQFFKTHVRVSLDLLNTRNKESRMIQTCLNLQQRFVIDNTNPTISERAKYIAAAREKRFKIISYFFKTIPGEAIERNSKREGKENIPVAGLLGTYKRLEKPSYEEGFDELFEVTLAGEGFQVARLKKK